MKRLAHRVPLLAIGLWLGVLGLWGCGSSTPQAKPAGAATGDPSAAPLPPLPRSSLAAVLLHRDELQLSDDQVKAIQDLDEELAARAKALTDRPPGGARPDGGAGQPRGSGGGGGKRMHMMGGRGGSGSAPQGTAGSGFRGSSSGSPKGARSLEERLDDADTRAYLQTEEEILNPEQRDRAREIAEKYREDLYDRRSRAAVDKE
jgi:hypothetical protein